MAYRTFPRFFLTVTAHLSGVARGHCSMSLSSLMLSLSPNPRRGYCSGLGLLASLSGGVKSRVLVDPDVSKERDSYDQKI